MLGHIAIEPGRSFRLMLVGALLLGVCGCGSPAATPTPSPLAQALVGQWVVTGGQEARTPITLGEPVTFQPDGHYLWGPRKGRYELFEESQITLRWSLGEAFSYDLKLAGDTLTLGRMTNCGKVEQFILTRSP